MNFDRTAAYFTVLYILALFLGTVQYHGDTLPAVGTGKKMFHE